MPQRPSAVFALLSLAACTSADTGGRTASEPAVLMPLPELGANGPELRRAAVAVSPYGHVAFTGGFHEGAELITIVDSEGRLVSRVGPEGAGPDELRAANYLFFRDSQLVVADAFQGRFKEYTLGGEHIISREMGALLLVYGHAGDSVDLADNGSDGPRVIRRAGDGTGGFRTLIAKGDTLYEQILERARVVRPALRFGNGSTREGTVYADGLDYTLYEFRPSGPVTFGRSLPANVQRGTTVDTISYFGLYSLGEDASGRLWAVGRDADGGFLDAWEDTTLVHHQTTSCLPNPLYGMSVAGSWLAMLCEAPEEASTEVTLQLYRLP